MNRETDDEALLEAMTAFEPGESTVERMARVIEARVERESAPLYREWFDIVRRRPLAYGTLAFAAAAALLITTPLGSLLWALLGAGSS